MNSKILRSGIVFLCFANGVSALVGNIERIHYSLRISRKQADLGKLQYPSKGGKLSCTFIIIRLIGKFKPLAECSVRREQY